MKELWKNPEYRKMQSESHKGYVHSKERNIKASITLKKNPPKTCFKKGSVPWNKGKKNCYSDESIKKMVNTRKENNSQKHTENTKTKMRLSHKGKKKSPEHIENVRQSLLGKKYSKKDYPNWGWRTSRKNQIFPVKDTKIEVKIQEFLKQLGIEFYTHQYIKDIKYGYQCDVFIPVQRGIPIKTIIECDGDYWHGNPEKYNYIKLSMKNKTKRILDYERTSQLQEQGFRVIRLWEHEINKMELNDLKNKVIK